MSQPGTQRALTARLLHAVVVEGRTTDQVLAASPVAPLTRELLLGSLRHYFSLEHAVDAALHRPLRAKDRDLKCLMIVGTYQLRHMRVPDHAAVFESVAACDDLGKPWAKGLVNAVLRRCAGAPENASERSFEHPEWLEQALRATYPDAEDIMTANNRRAPMTLRINLRRTTAADYTARLEQAGIRSRSCCVSAAPAGRGMRPGPETRVLEEARPAEDLPGYRDGLVSVQDAGAQLVPGLLGVRPGDRVLDACAAPGGKLFHLLERCPRAQLTALDSSADRLQGLGREAERLGHQGFDTGTADATGHDWWDGVPFQRVLVDAPCSGTGTLRRHPDIKVLRRAGDVAGQAALQGRLLASLWRVVEPGGTLLYCTCSMLAAENDEVVDGFLAAHPDARVVTLELGVGRATRHGWQLLPTEPDTDGFYYARMTKASEWKY